MAFRKIRKTIPPEIPEAMSKGNKLMHIRLSNKRRDRLAIVRELYFVEHRPQEEIAKQFGVCTHQITEDVHIIRELGKSVATHDLNLMSNVMNFLWEMNLAYQQRIKELWNLYKSKESNNVYVKMKILSEVKEQEKQYVRMLQESGIVKKKPDEHIHGIVYVSHLNKEKIEEKDREDLKHEKRMVDKQISAGAVPL